MGGGSGNSAVDDDSDGILVRVPSKKKSCIFYKTRHFTSLTKWKVNGRREKTKEEGHFFLAYRLFLYFFV